MEKKSHTAVKKNFLDDIRQQSEMLQLISAFDWNTSPLGPIDSWPQSLKNAVSLILQNGTPMYLTWGKDFTQFYNDGYRPFLGTNKHPKALGNNAKETWFEIWDFLNPLWESVLKTGQTVCGKDLKLTFERDGQLTDSYFSYSCSALCDDEGKIAGILSVSNEITSDIKLKQHLASAREESELEKAKLTSLFMQTPMPIAIFEGPEHHFILTNAAHEKFSGRKIEPGKTPLEVFSSAEASAFVSLLDEVYKTGVPYEGTQPVFLPDEKGVIQEHWINIGFYPYKNINGKIHGVMSIVQDLTIEIRTRKEAEESKRNLQLALERGRMGTWQIDLGDNKISYSKETKDLFSTDSQEGDVIDLIQRIVHPEDIDELINSMNAAIEKRKPFFHEYRIIKDNNQTRWFVSQGDVVLEKDGSCRYYAGTVQDITDRILNKIELEKAVLEAEMANQTKSFFLANMSHEIRTPLGAILGFTDLLKERKVTSEDQTKYLEIITRNGKSLTKIIDDILDLAKVESGNIEVENLQMSIVDLIDDVIEVFRESTLAKGIYLRADVAKDIPSRILSDPSRIRQILFNVIGNAVKFTEYGGVTIDVRTQNEGSKTKFIIAVKDTGVGISKEQATRLFKPFAQADNSTTRKFGGTGLGLVLSKRLANAISGDISIEDSSAENGGSTFIFTFLATTSQISSIQKDAEIKTTDVVEKKKLALQNLRILIADDSVDNRILVQLILSKHGAVVENAKNGLEAFKMGMNNTYDLILMDIQMPEMDGYEATRNLREAGFKKPIIALTAHAMAEERAQTLAAGCDGHLTKPINTAELIETISRHSHRVDKSV